MRLRPHHLLCTQGFRGKGYSSGFVKNMIAVTNRLRTEAHTPIQLVFTTDDLCAHCPQMLGEGLCEDQEKVLWFDGCVVEAFQLEEGEYDYQTLAARIRREMTPELLEHICGRCAWYPVSACRASLLEGDLGRPIPPPEPAPAS